MTTEQAERPYDFLVFATGHRSANEAVAGLGPFDGPGHSLMSAPETEELGAALAKLLKDPGPVVVGAAPGASCIGPAYEFAFELDHQKYAGGPVPKAREYVEAMLGLEVWSHKLYLAIKADPWDAHAQEHHG